MLAAQEWHQHGAAQMSQASSQRASASRQCAQSRRANEDSVTVNLSMYDELCKSLSLKVSNSHRLVEKLQRRQASVEGAIRQQRNSLQMLDQALRDKDAPLKLCAWRGSQRERRPLKEQVRDLVEASLEEEKQVLAEQQRKIGEAIRRTTASVQELEQTLEQLRREIEQKVQALAVDETCLKTTMRSYSSMAQRSRPPSAGPCWQPGGVKQARHQVALQESNRNELMRQQETAKMDKDALGVEQAAQVTRESNAKLAVRAEQAAQQAAARSEQKIRERVASMQALQKRLDVEIRETASKIERTREMISETKYRIMSLQEPMDMTSTCASLRQQRAQREQFSDSVTTNLHEHRVTVLHSHQELLAHRQQEKAQLKELEGRRLRLEEDLREKTASLQVDLSCLSSPGSLGGGDGRRKSRPASAAARPANAVARPASASAPGRTHRRPMPPILHSAR